MASDFASLVSQASPAPEILRTAYAMREKLWAHQSALAEGKMASLKSELINIERQVGLLLDRIVEAQVPSVINAYERRIKLLEEQRVSVNETLSRRNEPVRSFERTCQAALKFLADPLALYKLPNMDIERLVIGLIFSKHPSYTREKGFFEPELSSPINNLGQFQAKKQNGGAGGSRT
ncbi:hypothetical protein [Comamonas sp. BIGb0124]|uniref:hypothetical protein n=1 Tax=Comamonas sp. BIGb0124 TaxID=2485130 RepID=UPI000F483004|nr:hypothetical protein [Comamonas sp. BIGb0124]